MRTTKKQLAKPIEAKKKFTDKEILFVRAVEILSGLIKDTARGIDGAKIAPGPQDAVAGWIRAGSHIPQFLYHLFRGEFHAAARRMPRAAGEGGLTALPFLTDIFGLIAGVGGRISPKNKETMEKLDPATWAGKGAVEIFDRVTGLSPGSVRYDDVVAEVNRQAGGGAEPSVGAPKLS